MSDESSSSRSPSPHSHLPQLGFKDDVAFDSLVEHSPFLFRVYTPKPRSPSITYDKNVFCIAPRFNAKYASSPLDDDQALSPVGPIDEVTTCLDVIKHMEWTSRSSSPYITTSFNFAWAIWEALRRYNGGYKRDVEIAVLDAASLKTKAVTASQIMKQTPFDERPLNFGRWYQFSQESQSTLIYGYIPMSSVMTSIPLRSIVDKLPSYFLQRDLQDASDPFSRLAWDFSKKFTFKQFCREATKRYFEDPPEVRLHETIVDSVRLANAFLHPWFHKTIDDDAELVVDRVTQLASAIAAWPDPEDSAGLENVIRGMVALLAVEVRGLCQPSVLDQVSELVGVIDELEGVVASLEERLKAEERSEIHSDTEGEWKDDRTAYSPDAKPVKRKDSGYESPTPLRIAIPASRSGSMSSDSGSSPVSPMTPNSLTHSDAEFFGKGELHLPQTPPPPHSLSLSRFLESSSSPSHMRRRSFSPTHSRSSSFSRFHTSLPQTTSVAVQTVSELGMGDPPYPDDEPKLRSVKETVSYAVTGFVIGSLLTLCAASQRRTVLLHLT